MMEAENKPDTVSRNIVAEIQGTEYPEQVLIKPLSFCIHYIEACVMCVLISEDA